MTTTEDIILRWIPALRANPACDTTRLVLADALQESGDPDAVRRAEFIRVQIDLSHRNRVKDCNQSICVTAGHNRPCMNCREYEELRRREAELWNGGIHKQFMSLPGIYSFSSDRSVEYDFLISRGFISRVEGTLEQLRGGVHTVRTMQIGGDWIATEDSRITPGVLASIVRLNPVEWCEVTDKKPLAMGDSVLPQWRWLMDDGYGGAAMIPDNMFELMPKYQLPQYSTNWGRFYDSESDAKAELSRVLIEEAIELAAELEPAQ